MEGVVIYKEVQYEEVCITSGVDSAWAERRIVRHPNRLWLHGFRADLRPDALLEPLSADALSAAALSGARSVSDT